jgi:hypothetical protein
MNMRQRIVYLLAKYERDQNQNYLELQSILDDCECLRQATLS